MSTAPSTPNVAPVSPDDPGWSRPAASARDLRIDAVMAVVFLVSAVLSLSLYGIAGFYDDPAPLWQSLIWAVAITVPLAWRRRWPSVVALIISITFIVGSAIRVPELLINNISLFLALYSVGVWLDNRRKAALIRALIIAAMLGWLLISMFQAATDPDALTGLSRVGAFSPLVAYMLIQIMTNVLYFGAAYFFGDRAYNSTRDRARLEERTRELEAERERTSAQAIALERVRIARELHDVVAHHVSTMGVQAGAARTVMTMNPDAARDALSNIEISARSAIDELHNLLITLREPGEAAAATAASTLGHRDLSTLANDSTTAGMPTTVEIIGDGRPVPAVISLNLYRIAQEALTNARKYAGAAATADVRLRYLASEIEIEIANTGTVPASPRPGGLGQQGMKERAAASGGTMEFGPRPRGGYLVRARIPLPVAILEVGGPDQAMDTAAGETAPNPAGSDTSTSTSTSQGATA